MRQVKNSSLMTLLGLMVFAAPAWAFVITLTQRDIQSQVEKKFPITEESDFYTLTLKNPKVDLQEGSGRIGLIANAAVATLMGESSGVIHIDGAIKYVRERGEFILGDATARAVEIEGMSAMVRQKVAELATEVLRDYFNKNPIYKLKADASAEAAIKSALKSVTVKDGKLQVELGLP